MLNHAVPLIASLTWLDHDSAAAERSMRLMALLEEKEARDELGVGAIRDAISDQLFPGTSTIQTRLRYFFFIPWLFEQLDSKRTRSAVFAGEARRSELNLLLELLATHENDPKMTNGIIGSRARGLLKRMPSSVYWAGLESWGIRNLPGSLHQYMADSDERLPPTSDRRRRESDEDFEIPEPYWWPEVIRLRPIDFPANASMLLSNDEAVFLLERWKAMHSESLLTWLALELRDVDTPPQADQIWNHEFKARFPQQVQHLVQQAKNLNALTRGAALLYNLQLAELDNRKELALSYIEALNTWRTDEWTEISDWDLNELWRRVERPKEEQKVHSPVSQKTRLFVENWLAVTQAAGGNIGNSQAARDIVRQREQALKKESSSRFLNVAARKQWGGAAGMVPMSYRWPTAETYLREWHRGWRNT